MGGVSNKYSRALGRSQLTEQVAHTHAMTDSTLDLYGHLPCLPSLGLAAVRHP